MISVLVCYDSALQDVELTGFLREKRYLFHTLNEFKINSIVKSHYCYLLGL